MGWGLGNRIGALSGISPQGQPPALKGVKMKGLIIGFIFFAMAIGVFVRWYLIPTISELRIRRKNQAPRNVAYALSRAQIVEGLENLRRIEQSGKRIQAVLIALQLTMIGLILTV